MKNYKLILVSCFVYITLSCTKETEPNPSLDFSRYVSVGNSLTAGVSNNGLYNVSIQNSYPNLISGQLAKVGGGSFAQPLFAAGQENGTGYLKLKGYNGLIPIIETVSANTALRSNNPPLLVKYKGDNQNLGIPFMKMADIDSPGLSSNVFYERLLPDGTTGTTYLQMLATAKPSFFFCGWATTTCCSTPAAVAQDLSLKRRYLKVIQKKYWTCLPKTVPKAW